ncbi:15 kDa selenoprotein [Strongyloides ratti]|uniref:Selenoprotein F n=1 Tax=Strongyloides ratti TaxID=34506 RepID=A0A090MWB2_STRRB|nr:15 kDa selenoprotein [Strongyloides ratti]CEF63594.1 15 kDa selenoprotein [Strongyloides ratti]
MVRVNKFIKSIFFIFTFSILLLDVFGEDDFYTIEECKDLGFNKDTLRCSTCDKLTQFSLEELYTDCKSCCWEEKDKVHEKYAFAYIEYCECNIARFPQAQAFIKSGMVSEWGNQLKVKHVRGSLPTLVMKDKKGMTIKSFNIESWDTNTIKEFLDGWLE